MRPASRGPCPGSTPRTPSAHVAPPASVGWMPSPPRAIFMFDESNTLHGAAFFLMTSTMPVSFFQTGGVIQ